MAQYLMILVLLSLGFALCDEENNNIYSEDIIFEPSWTYKCVGIEGCQRAERPQPSFFSSKEPHPGVFDSLDECRTACGRFGGLWPRPVTAALSQDTVKIHPNNLRFDLIDVPAETRPLLVEMTQVVTSNLLAECDGNVTDLVDTTVMVYITVRSKNLALTWDTDEEYMLDVQTKGVDISVNVVAETVYGIRHGLESLTQLVAASRPNYDDQRLCSLSILSGAKVRDRPVYKHRGLLIDTSRNFIPLEDIKRMIDGMAATKMNVFHWHITDSHSFPLESIRVPQLTRYGAYSPAEIYTVEEVRDLVRYAQVRGVRVVLEIDAPAHAGNGWQWGKEYGYGDLAVCVNQNPWRQLCIQPPCGQLNPANPKMYRVLKDLYRDIAEMIPHPTLLHMGGDEVFFPCWNSSQEIVSYMMSKGYDLSPKGFLDLWAEFHSLALQFWDEEYKAVGGESEQPVMLWSSELTRGNKITSYLDKNRYVIEVWEPVDSPLLSQLLNLGYRTVSVPKDIWYLDHGFWGTTKYSNWRRMYSHMLPKNKNVLGGEVAMWSEYVDASVIDTRIWPRAAAVAERLWADPTSAAVTAEPRLQRLRTRMIARGLRPDVLSPMWCAQHDTKCY